jgi:hypothetical protein
MDGAPAHADPSMGSAARPMNDTIPKAALFERLGYGGSHDLLEAALADAGLSRPAKSGIAAAKADAVAALLADRFVPVCGRGDCQADAEAAGDARTTVAAATAADCAMCQGSSNARAVDALVAALHDAGLNRLCVVGGSPTAHTSLTRLAAGRIELRLIDGTASRSAAQAKADLAWADLVAIWGSTILSHKVSALYRGRHVILMARRSIRDLAGEVAAALGEGGGARRGLGRR